MADLRFAAAMAALTLVFVLHSPGARAQSAEAGRRIFQNTCGLCHAAQPGRNRIGPSLFGVVNRPSGQIPGFNYSEANRHSGLTWTVPMLDRYLAAPSQVVPGTYMTFPGLKDPEQRADVIAYLATLH